MMNPSIPASATAPALDPALQEIVGYLASAELFSKLAHDDPERLVLFAPLFSQASYSPGTVIAREGDVDTTLWVIAKGVVSMQRYRPGGGVDQLGLRGIGQVIGLRGVFAGTPRTHSAVVSDAATMLYADAARLWEVLSAYPGLIDQLVLPEPLRAQIKVPVTGSAIPGEYEIGCYRRHWVAIVPRLIILPLLAFLPFVAIAFVLSWVLPSTATMLSAAGLGLGMSVLFGVWLFFDWRYDRLILTNRRLVHSERTPFINASEGAARLDRIQDVRVVQPSLFARVLGYGDITIQTAGTRGLMKFTTVPKPGRIREAVFRQIELAKAMVGHERQRVVEQKVRAATGQAPAVMVSGTPLSVMSQRRARVQRTGGLLGLGGVIGLWTAMEDENGTITWRKHWWVLIRHAFLPFCLTTALTLLMGWMIAQDLLATATSSGATAATAAAGEAAATGATVAWPWITPFWLLALAWLGWRFADWRNDIYQLTYDHVIDIEQLPLGFFSERRQAALAQIQDVRYTKPNIVANMLNYGNVIIETAGGGGMLTFDYVHRPASVQAKIFARMHERELRQQHAEQERRDEDMMRWISMYHQVTRTDPQSPAAGAAPPASPPVVPVLPPDAKV